MLVMKGFAATPALVFKFQARKTELTKKSSVEIAKFVGNAFYQMVIFIQALTIICEIINSTL